MCAYVFFFNDTATTEIYTLSLHDALPILNSTWGYSTLFVRLSEISEVMLNGFEFLISNLRTYTDVLGRTEQVLLSRGINTGVSSASYNKAPIWLHCTCGSKAPASFFRSEERRVGKECRSRW